MVTGSSLAREPGALALLVFFASMWASRTLAVLALLVLLFLFSRQRAQLWPLMRRSVPCWLALLWMGYVTASALVFAAVYRDYAFEMLNQGLRLLYLGGFPLLALALHRQPQLLLPGLFLLLLGFLLARLFHLGVFVAGGGELLSARPALGLHTAIALAQYTFALIIGLFLFAPRLLSGRLLWLRVGAWLVVLLFLWWLILMSQTRSIWLLIPVLTPLLVIAVALLRGASWRATLGIAALAVVAALLLAYPFCEMIAQRMSFEFETLLQLVRGELQQVQAVGADGGERPIGVRVKMIEYGMQAWWQRPLFGWGPGASKMLLECCAPDAFIYNDLHSFVPEILVRLGLVGFLLLVAMNLSLVQVALRAYRAGRLPWDLLLLVLFGLLLHWGVALANFRMVNYDWRFYWYVLAGIAAACSLAAPPASTVSASSASHRPHRRNPLYRDPAPATARSRRLSSQSPGAAPRALARRWRPALPR